LGLSYTPIEGGIPQNLLDEFRNISTAFARVKLELEARMDKIKEEVLVELPEFPDFKDSDAYKDLNREVTDVEALMQERLAEYNSRIEQLKQELGDAVIDYYIRDNSILGKIEELKGTLLELQKEGSTLTARVWGEIRTRIDETGALAERVTLLEVSGGGYDDTALWAAIATEEQARIDGDAALASSLTLLGAQNGGGTAFILDQATVYVDPTTSWASWETTLQASIDDKATITQWQEVRDDTNSILAKAGLQLNVNNHIIGWALNNDGASGDMVIQVDKFFIVTPGDAPEQIFAADVTGVYINSAYIKNLTVDVLTAGTLSVPIDLTGSITIPNTGYIRSGQTAWNTGTGWWMGHEGGVPKFSLGNPASQGLNWSAATGLQITGSITLTSPIPSGDVSGLGTLATLNSADYATNVSGTKPPSDATRNSVTTGTAAPSGGVNGDLYYRTGTTLPGWWSRVGGTWYHTGDVTQTKIDGGIITTGFVELSTNGHIRSGKANYADNATSGFFLGRDGSTPKFNIGNATQYLRWTGTALQVGGPIVSLSNINEAISFVDSSTLASLNLTASYSTSLSLDISLGSRLAHATITLSCLASIASGDFEAYVEATNADYPGTTFTTDAHVMSIPPTGQRFSTTWILPMNATLTNGIWQFKFYIRSRSGLADATAIHAFVTGFRK
jgi:hypothetical protein